MNISEKKISELNKLESEAEISFDILVEKLSEKYSFDCENDFVMAIQDTAFNWKDIDDFIFRGDKLIWISVLRDDFKNNKDLKDDDVIRWLTKIENRICELTEYQSVIDERISELNRILNICKE